MAGQSKLDTEKKSKEDDQIHSWQFTYSVDRNVHATEYEEIIKFVKKYAYYYAIKAEDVDGEGKVHVHWMMVNEKATYAHAARDYRYGAKKKSHLKGYFAKTCPNCMLKVNATKDSMNHALTITKLTSDIVVTYYSKETMLRTSHLPDDCCVLNEYLAEINPEKPKNPIHDSHVKVYKELGYPVPATNLSCWEYFDYRMHKANDMPVIKTQTVLIDSCKTLCAHINEGGRAPPPCFLEKPAKKPKITYVPGKLTEQLAAEFFDK